MDTSSDISGYLRSEEALAAKQHMEQSLSDIFRLMFNLDLASAADKAAVKKQEALAAHVYLKHEKVTACIVLHVLKETASLIASKVGAEVPSSNAVLQDIVCEIVNILGNSLRAFLVQNLGLRFETGDIASGVPDKDVARPGIVINLDFQVNPEALVNLDFTCGERILN
ncbi:MAG: hypothetical protein PHE27_07720 [Alphaproteobacteria bacterium]|nr:hypothetical protein [Alphaproteobacteria bacterium]